MSSLRTRRAAIAGLALVILATLIPLGEATSHNDEELVHMGAWAPGDNWVWKKDPTSARGSRSHGNLTWSIAAEENVTLDLWEPEDGVEWRTQHMWRMHSWLNTSIPTEQTSVEIRQSNVMYRRVADQSLVRSEVDDRYVISLGNGSSQEGHTEKNFERFPPMVEMQFPFAVGDAWRVRSEQRFVEFNSDDCGGPDQRSCRGGGPKAYTYEVVGTDELTLTLNGEQVTLDTHRIKVTDETTGRGANDKSYEIWWYAQEACNVVLREQYSADRQKIGVFTLTEYRCSGETTDDPDYSAWDFDAFSSTRFHGALSEDALKGVRPDPPQRAVSFFSPAPPAALVVLALVGAVAVAARRRLT